MGTKAFITLKDWLEGRAQAIRTLESKAEKVLHDDQDQNKYRQIMLEKATLLANLAEEAAPLVSHLPEHERGTVSDRLSRFSQSASVAKRIGSVFYMSALLYPEDHKPGEKNDLETFIDSVKVLAEGE
ncbi:hypothetical protein N1030_02960 [Desulfovibrio mangrovi]|uniref:hypothetical protein n=1 Tax=Desulfovibrio mangrovi TaxID=2976983 RepID=UPI0022454ADC|nr:hypothetical protein [Desulfovibrio mangrovi]UZP67954.1 hypothetical protein N1030_02960 [Desulfovibrio mangrovi]